MILVAGLTPAWQQIMCFADLRSGKVNRADEVHWCASGKAINVALALEALGLPVQLVSPAGGWSGSAMRSELVERKIATTWISTDASTRICTTILDQRNLASTELVENASALTKRELAEVVAAIHHHGASADAIVMTGSLPKGTSTSFYRDILQSTSRPVVLDARGPELLSALECKPRVVKPNREELEMTVGRPLPDRAAVLAAMGELIQRGASSVIVTDGKAPVLVMDEGSAWELTPPAVTPIVNPIGCGDCLAAGIAWGLTQGEAFIDAARLGMAMAADNLAQLLPSRITRQRVDEIAPLVRVASIRP